MVGRTGPAAIVLLFVSLAVPAHAAEPVVGGPCEGCENVFVGLPPDLSPRARIAGPDEAGEPMIIEGTVRALDGRAAAGIVVYAYHTNAQGVYPVGTTRHGALRGWARTDTAGAYRFDTVRPGHYPGRNTPQHVHMHVIEPGRVTYYIDDILFDDDPVLTPALRRRMVRGRGGEGVCHPAKDAEGVWHVRRDIVLGKNIPEYPCPRAWTFPVPFYQSLSWSPDGSRIAVSAVTTTWEDGYRIFLVNVDGTGATPLETGSAGDLYPVWSPDGARIAFTARRRDPPGNPDAAVNSDVCLVNPDGTGLLRLTRHPANDGYPSWSPDGARIAFHSNRDGNYEIYVMNADGTGQVRLTDNPADDYNPAWSPDGTRIAFESDRDGVGGDEIYCMAADGTALTPSLGAGVFPAWSADGRNLLVASEGLREIPAVPGETPTSGEQTVLERAVCGVWSPDGSRIAAAEVFYDENCKDHHRVVIVGADGTGRTQLLP